MATNWADIMDEGEEDEHVFDPKYDPELAEFFDSDGYESEQNYDDYDEEGYSGEDEMYEDGHISPVNVNEDFLLINHTSKFIKKEGSYEVNDFCLVNFHGSFPQVYTTDDMDYWELTPYKCKVTRNGGDVLKLFLEAISASPPLGTGWEQTIVYMCAELTIAGGLDSVQDSDGDDADPLSCYSVVNRLLEVCMNPNTSFFCKLSRFTKDCNQTVTGHIMTCRLIPQSIRVKLLANELDDDVKLYISKCDSNLSHDNGYCGYCVLVPTQHGNQEMNKLLDELSKLINFFRPPLKAQMMCWISLLNESSVIENKVVLHNISKQLKGLVGEVVVIHYIFNSEIVPEIRRPKFQNGRRCDFVTNDGIMMEVTWTSSPVKAHEQCDETMSCIHLSNSYTDLWGLPMEMFSKIPHRMNTIMKKVLELTTMLSIEDQYDVKNVHKFQEDISDFSNANTDVVDEMLTKRLLMKMDVRYASDFVLRKGQFSYLNPRLDSSQETYRIFREKFLERAPTWKPGTFVKSNSDENWGKLLGTIREKHDPFGEQIKEFEPKTSSDKEQKKPERHLCICKPLLMPFFGISKISKEEGLPTFTKVKARVVEHAGKCDQKMLTTMRSIDMAIHAYNGKAIFTYPHGRVLVMKRTRSTIQIHNTKSMMKSVVNNRKTKLFNMIHDFKMTSESEDGEKVFNCKTCESLFYHPDWEDKELDIIEIIAYKIVRSTRILGILSDAEKRERIKDYKPPGYKLTDQVAPCHDCMELIDDAINDVCVQLKTSEYYPVPSELSGVDDHSAQGTSSLCFKFSQTVCCEMIETWKDVCLCATDSLIAARNYCTYILSPVSGRSCYLVIAVGGVPDIEHRNYYAAIISFEPPKTSMVFLNFSRVESVYVSSTFIINKKILRAGITVTGAFYKGCVTGHETNYHAVHSEPGCGKCSISKNEIKYGFMFAHFYARSNKLDSEIGQNFRYGMMCAYGIGHHLKSADKFFKIPTKQWHCYLQRNLYEGMVEAQQMKLRFKTKEGLPYPSVIVRGMKLVSFLDSCSEYCLSNFHIKTILDNWQGKIQISDKFFKAMYGAQELIENHRNDESDVTALNDYHAFIGFPVNPDSIDENIELCRKIFEKEISHDYCNCLMYCMAFSGPAVGSDNINPSSKRLDKGFIEMANQSSVIVESKLNISENLKDKWKEWRKKRKVFYSSESKRTVVSVSIENAFEQVRSGKRASTDIAHIQYKNVEDILLLDPSSTTEREFCFNMLVALIKNKHKSQSLQDFMDASEEELDGHAMPNWYWIHMQDISDDQQSNLGLAILIHHVRQEFQSTKSIGGERAQTLLRSMIYTVNASLISSVIHHKVNKYPKFSVRTSPRGKNSVYVPQLIVDKYAPGNDVSVLWECVKSILSTRVSYFGLACKEQVGAPRELFVPTIESRLRLMFMERVSEHICKLCKGEMLSKPKDKVRILTNIIGNWSDEAASKFVEGKIVPSCDDHGQWGTKLSPIAIVCASLAVLHENWNSLFWRAGLHHYVKRVEIVDALIMKWVKGTLDKSNDYRRWISEWLDDMKAYIDAPTGMGQGMQHFGSSILQVISMHVCKLLLEEKYGIRIHFLVSSDDRLMIYCGCSYLSDEAVADIINTTVAVGRLLGMNISPKINYGVGIEYNSVFSDGRKIMPVSGKFEAAQCMVIPQATWVSTMMAIANSMMNTLKNGGYYNRAWLQAQCSLDLMLRISGFPKSSAPMTFKGSVMLSRSIILSGSFYLMETLRLLDDKHWVVMMKKLSNFIKVNQHVFESSVALDEKLMIGPYPSVIFKKFMSASLIEKMKGVQTISEGISEFLGNESFLDDFTKAAFRYINGMSVDCQLCHAEKSIKDSLKHMLTIKDSFASLYKDFVTYCKSHRSIDTFQGKLKISLDKLIHSLEGDGMPSDNDYIDMYIKNAPLAKLDVIEQYNSYTLVNRQSKLRSFGEVKMTSGEMVMGSKQLFQTILLTNFPGLSKRAHMNEKIMDEDMILIKSICSQPMVKKTLTVAKDLKTPETLEPLHKAIIATISSINSYRIVLFSCLSGSYDPSLDAIPNLYRHMTSQLWTYSISISKGDTLLDTESMEPLGISSEIAANVKSYLTINSSTIRLMGIMGEEAVCKLVKEHCLKHLKISWTDLLLIIKSFCSPNLSIEYMFGCYLTSIDVDPSIHEVGILRQTKYIPSNYVSTDGMMAIQLIDEKIKITTDKKGIETNIMCKNVLEYCHKNKITIKTFCEMALCTDQECECDLFCEIAYVVNTPIIIKSTEGDTHSTVKVSSMSFFSNPVIKKLAKVSCARKYTCLQLQVPSEIVRVNRSSFVKQVGINCGTSLARHICGYVFSMFPQSKCSNDKWFIPNSRRLAECDILEQFTGSIVSISTVMQCWSFPLLSKIAYDKKFLSCENAIPILLATYAQVKEFKHDCEEGSNDHFDYDSGSEWTDNKNDINGSLGFRTHSDGKNITKKKVRLDKINYEFCCEYHMTMCDNFKSAVMREISSFVHQGGGKMYKFCGIDVWMVKNKTDNSVKFIVPWCRALNRELKINWKGQRSVILDIDTLVSFYGNPHEGVLAGGCSSQSDTESEARSEKSIYSTGSGASTPMDYD